MRDNQKKNLDCSQRMNLVSDSQWNVLDKYFNLRKWLEKKGGTQRKMKNDVCAILYVLELSSIGLWLKLKSGYDSENRLFNDFTYNDHLISLMFQKFEFLVRSLQQGKLTVVKEGKASDVSY